MVIILILVIVFLLLRYKRNYNNGRKGLAIVDAIIAGIIFVIGFIGSFIKRLLSS